MMATIFKSNLMVPCSFMLLFIPYCSAYHYSCKGHLSSDILHGNSTWKLCLLKLANKGAEEAALQFKIKSLFPDKKSTGWLSIGFPNKKLDYVPFFMLEAFEKNSVKVQQTDKVRDKVNCSVSGKGHHKLVSVVCVFKKTMHEYADSKRVKIYWNIGIGSMKVDKVGEKLTANHSTLTFYPENQLPAETAGETAMRLLRNYGKNMGIIIGISFLLTALITLTICCCCKKKTPHSFNKQKFSKNDSSVSFYRDESEGDGQSEESDNDDDDDGEEAKFIRNNNARDSSV